ncbi:ABC transporter permease [Apilactobacillus micheneri]|uniref:ABC transporter permease n=1 Tax=Apilactobacillus micheneri TaxID=1899430 RepID=A0A9Q8ILI5_9LACO|nr:ABC transporter permease [Apilactobacillus micheneri]TPR39183.1 ABC transporter permease [Apilactobacillus micheneri]TPR43088.1 ABC transporter permease [Apilactobacillus micheneri]TPR44068.1 ABC transporter permease [Apilactobacillus micheneri]
MRKINEISKRLGKELLKDKRTLAMILLAPILIMWLMSLVFSANTSTNVNVGTINVNNGIRTELSDVKNVKVNQYKNEKNAKNAMKNGKIDAFVSQKDNKLDVIYSNTDSSKTSLAKMGLQSSLTNSTLKNLSNKVETLANANQQMQIKTGATNNNLNVKNAPKQSALKISNHYVYGNSKTNYFNTLIPILMAFFVFLFVFLVSGMALLKERTSGTLDRLLATPVKRSEIILGYLQTYGLLSIIQTIIIVLVTVWLLNIQIVGSILSVIIVNVLVALVALTAGLLVSTLASSEFQMVQFIPVIVVPQIFFSGIIPFDSLPHWLNIASYILPLRYATDAQSAIVFNGKGLTDVWVDILILIIYAMVLTIINIVGLKRYRKV